MSSELKSEIDTNENYDINRYCNLTLEQIINISDINIRHEMLKLYKAFIESNMTNRIRKNVITNCLLINNDDHLSRRVKTCIIELNKLLNNHVSEKLKYNNNVVSINNAIYTSEYNNTSTFISPGDTILFYPRIREFRAIKEITCDIHGSVIHIGSYYIEYRPLIDNITNKKSYVLKKSIKAEIGYLDILPTNLHVFEEWMRRTDISYTTESYDSDISFYEFHCNHGPLSLTRLSKDKIKIKEETIEEPQEKTKKKGRNHSKK